MSDFDAVVAGVGGMGSAACAHLARRGLDVLGLERYDVPHDRGSSHGRSRIIRLAYFEHPDYVPLLRRAYDLWRDLERETGRDLLRITGSIDAGPPDCDVVSGSKRACAEHGLDHEVLSGDAVGERFPGYDLPADYEAVYQPDGGFLVPEQCTLAHVETALEAGATIRARERVVDWREAGDGVRVETDRGTYEADALVVTAGAWTGDLLPELGPHLEPERQVVGWFRPDDPDAFAPEVCPVFIIDDPGAEVYGFPIYDVPGVKVGVYHHRGETGDPERMAREPTPTDERLLRKCLGRYFPFAEGTTLRLSTCLFTNSPDGNFVLDAVREEPRVVVGAGFSGHGFKFASVVGEVLADLTADGETEHPIGRFRADRLE